MTRTARNSLLARGVLECMRKGRAAYPCIRSAAANIGSVTFERITTNTDVMGGVPCIRGLRFPVATVVVMVADGMTTSEILAENPDLTSGDIHESLLYAAEAVRERELPLRPRREVPHRQQSVAAAR